MRAMTNERDDLGMHIAAEAEATRIVTYKLGPLKGKNEEDAGEWIDLACDIYQSICEDLGVAPYSDSKEAA